MIYHITIPTHPSLADPAHRIRYYIPSEDVVKSGLTTLKTTKWIGMHGDRKIRFVIKILVWLINRHIGKYKKGSLIV